MDHRSKKFRDILLPVSIVALFSTSAVCQTSTFGPAVSAPDAPSTAVAMPTFDVSAFQAGAFGKDATAPSIELAPGPQPGIVKRSVKRTLEDQKEIYFAPFKPSNFKWDALVLAPTATFLVTDHHIENNLPDGHYAFYQNTSDIAIGGSAATLAGVWILRS